MHQGIENKVSKLLSICDKYQVKPSNVAYIGDDLNDLECIKICGYTAAPADAVAFDGVAFTVAHAEGEVCDRCRRVDPTAKERSYGVTICDHCAEIVEANFPEAVAEGFEVKAK